MNWLQKGGAAMSRQGTQRQSGARGRRLTLLFVAAVVLLIPGLGVAHAPTCPETWNPAGQPSKFTGVPAGWSTAPGTTNTSTPINPDGFFIINSDAGPVTLIDGCGCAPGFGGTEDAGGGTCFVFGTFPSGTTIKYTEANGKTPNIEPMASNKNTPPTGNATFIDFHLWGQGDLEVCNTVGCSCCRVPPPPFSNEPAP